MPQLHKKILELRNRVGSSPIHYSIAVEQPVELRTANSKTDNGRLLKQYFAVWGQKDDYGTEPMKGCFEKSIQERGPNSNSTYKIKVLWQHNQSEPLCNPSVLKEDEIGLYGEYSPDEGISTCDRCVIQVRSGTINNGSHGFNYVWDKMVYDEQTDSIKMYECALYEVSAVTIPSQYGTFAVRSSSGELIDEFLTEETEDFIKRAVSRKDHLELRNIISRHITLAKNQPLEVRQQALEVVKPQQGGIDYRFLIDNLKIT